MSNDRPGSRPPPLLLEEHAITVLMVDDQQMLGEAVRRMLVSENDVRFHFCHDPTRAMREALELRPTVILQDLVMPELDGITLVKAFRAQAETADVPIIVLSTKEDPKVKAAAFSAGANDYIVKFPSAIELIARIRHHSTGYINLLQRNDAYDALEKSRQQIEKQSRFIRETFGRYVSEEVVSTLLETPGGLNLGGETRVVTILMADLRGFTPIAERYSASQVVFLINNFLGVMTDIIMRHAGTIVEFLGDAILAVFGAPILQANDARRAVACALDMQLAMSVVNAKNAEASLPDVRMGIGLHTGEVVAGNVGSAKRAKYGVVGSNVNLTSRIESFTVGGQILISDETKRDAGDDVLLAQSMSASPKGVRGAITLHDVVGIGAPYHLALARTDEPFVTLAAPFPIHVTLFEAKQESTVSVVGLIVRASSTELDIEADVAVAALSEVKLTLGDASSAPEVYGKVLGRAPLGPPRFTMRITSCSPEGQAMLTKLRSA